MWIIKKYNQKRRVKELIYKDFENALANKDYARTVTLSKRFLKLSKHEDI